MWKLNVIKAAIGIFPVDNEADNTINSGLDALFNAHTEPITDFPQEDQIHQTDILLIYPSPLQPRKTFSEAELSKLAGSIKQHGVLQPLILRQKEEGYEIIAGERRWRAAKIAGLVAVPAIIKDVDDKTALAFAIIENLQRENLNILEEAYALQRLIEEFKMTHEQVAHSIGRSRAVITNTLRLLTLSEPIKEMLSRKQLGMGHARSLLTLPAKQQAILAQRIVEKNLTVRDAERLVQQCTQPREKKPSPYANEVDAWVNRLSHSLSSKVAVNINEKGEGRVVIHFSSPEEANWLVDQLADNIEM